MDENNLQVEVTLTTEDVYSFQKSVIFRRVSPTVIIVVSVALILYGGFLSVTGFMSGRYPAGELLLFLIPLFLLVIFPRTLKKSSNNALNTSKLLQKTQTYKFSSNKIEISHDSGNALIKWDELYKAVETRESFQFFISKYQAYIVPKRCLDGKNEIAEAIREFIKSVPVPEDEKKKGVFGKGLSRLIWIYGILFLVILFTLVFLQNK